MSLTMLLIVNKRIRIDGLRYLWLIMGAIIVITVCDMVEDIYIINETNYGVLYVKVALVLWVYPLIALLALLFIAEIEYKILISIPYLINFVLVFSDMFGTKLVFYFNSNNQYRKGSLSLFPILVVFFYISVLGVYSISYIFKGDRSKGIVVLFLTISTILTAVGELTGFTKNSVMDEILAMEVLIYYFFLAAINYSKTQSRLYESQIELEHQKNKLLVMQMQPHFIFNALATIQSLCYMDNESAADCIDVFGDYLRANIDSIATDETIDFESELEHVNQYVKLEKASTDVEINVIYDLEVRDFKIPPLTVQPVVENSIKHGALTRRDGTGVVKIKTDETNERIRIIVSDNGIGASLNEKQKEHKSVGTQNVRQRLAILCGGTLDVNISENGTVSVITIPKSWKNAVRG